MKNKNILLIGGTGTLGKVILEELYKKEFNIIYSSKSRKKIHSITVAQNIQQRLRYKGVSVKGGRVGCFVGLR